MIGSRDADRARELAAVYGVEGGANEEIVGDADLVVLSTALERRARHGAGARRRDRRDAAAVGREPTCASTTRACTRAGIGRSLAEEIAEVVPGAASSRASTRSPPRTSAPREPPDEDVLVCGDDRDGEGARARARRRGSSAGRAIDAGPLANARALEGLTAVILNVNRATGGTPASALTGLPD